MPSPPPKDPLSKFRLDSMVQGLYTLERGAMLDCVNKLVNQVFDKIIQVYARFLSEMTAFSYQEKGLEL